MLSLLYGRQQDVYTKAINLTIDKYIDCFDEWAIKVEKNEAADDLIYDQVYKYVRNTELVNQLFVFVPAALTRLWFERQPIRLSESYSKTNGDSQARMIRLKGLAVYRQIMVVLRSRLSSLSNEDAYKILIHSSEFKIIDYALNQSISLENVKISPFTSEI